MMHAGVGRPKLGRVLVPCAKLPFSKVVEAVKSNRDLGAVISLVLERPPVAGGEGARGDGYGSQGGGDDGGDGQGAGGGAEGLQEKGGEGGGFVFDPRIL